MSKLAAFLSKNRRKPTKADDIPTGGPPQPGLALGPAEKTGVGAAEGGCPVVDVVQPKILEQWGVEDEEIADVVVIPVVPAIRRADSDDEDEEEIDLPSSKVRGNFEWKRKQQDEPAPVVAEIVEAAPPREPIIGAYLPLRKKALSERVADLKDASAFPELGGPVVNQAEGAVLSPKGSSRKQKKAARLAGDKIAAQNKPLESAAATAEKTKQKTLSAEQIYKILGKWPAGWPKVAFDEVAWRNRIQRRVAQPHAG